MNDVCIPWIARACALAAAMTLGGCGDDGSDESSGATEDPTTSPSSTPTTDDPTTSGGPTTDPTTDGTTDATMDPTGDPTGVMVVYETDIQPIWDASCVVGCHVAGGSGQMQSGLVLNPGESHASMVGVQSPTTALKIVEPGSTTDSYLWHKLQGTHLDVGGGGLSMPPGVKLDQAKLDLVEAWINGGAMP
jgi:hypothetical protein